LTEKSAATDRPGQKWLRAAIREHGRVEGDLLKVDDFLNHRVDARLLAAISSDLVEPFARPDLLLTAEASGISPALACALHLDVPMVFAKKYLGPGSRHTFFREVYSPTRGSDYRVEVARRVLPAGLGVVVVDDFLAGGRTAEALGEIIEEAACAVIGFTFVIEKAFQKGRERLEAHGWQVESLIRITSLADGVISLAD
jgi:xanthine phosphoribosyltransferase